MDANVWVAGIVTVGLGIIGLLIGIIKSKKMSD